MTTLHIILTVIQVLCAVALVAIVMLQTGKNDISAITGSADGFMSRNKSSSREVKLANYTKWFAGVFLVLTLVLNLF